MQIEFTYFNENGDEVPASYHENEKQIFLPGFTRGIKWNAGSGEISFVEQNTIINACPLQARPLILLLYDNSIGAQNNRCYVHELNGRFVQEIVYPGFGKCVELSVRQINGDVSKIICVMKRPIRNGWASECSTFYFDETNLIFGDAVNVWTES